MVRHSRDQDSHPEDDAAPKRQKLRHPSVPPPSFWDALSEVPLCASALRELDRRNTRRELSPNQSSLGRCQRDSQSSVKRDSSNATTTQSTGPYDGAFQQNLIDHRIYPNRYRYHNGQAPPRLANLDEIREILSRSRQSLSPSQFSEERFEKFLQADAEAVNDTDVMLSVIPIIEGDIGDLKCFASDESFANLDHLTDGSLKPGKPDQYYGARPEQLDQNIRRELGGYIIPSTQHDLPIAPNFFLEAKGPDGDLSVATRQACDTGALGARGIQALQSYKEPELKYNNKAYTLTSIYSYGQLKIYTSHPIQPSMPGGEPGYVMTQAGAYAMTNDISTFRQGAGAYRNGMDLTKEMRNEAIRQANGKVVTDELGGSGPSFATVVSGNTEPASQDTITHLESHEIPSLHNSDTPVDPTDVVPIGKRRRASGNVSFAPIASCSEPREGEASGVSPLKQAASNLDILDDGEEAGRPGEPDHAA